VSGGVRRGPLIAVGIAAAARMLPLFLGYEHYGDSPVRIETAQYWAQAPHLWHGFLEAYQYGPLHLTLIGALIRVLGDRVAAARLLSLGCGLACVWLLHAIAKRERGPEAAWWAALGLALSPLHIQASTTGASEAVFLAGFLGALLCVLEDRVLLAALLIGAAGLVRYDGWIYLPLLGALLYARFRDPLRASAFCALGAVPALYWMWVNAHFAGDALAPIHWIDHDHRILAESALRWFGQARWRAYGLVYFPLAVCCIATPVLGALSLWGSARALRRRQPGWELVVVAWLPALYLTLRTSVLGDFRPMARFAMVTAALSLVFAHDVLLSVSRAWRKPLLYACIALLVATPLALAALSFRRDGKLAEWARPLSPISSLPPGIAEAAQWVKQNVKDDDVILLDGVWDYLDIPLAFAANLPERQWVRAAWEKEFEGRLKEATPTMAILIYQGKLGDFTKDRFDFRGLHFCEATRFRYAAIYRRCL
jgi:4-amino-4-deoxy-L-arabinose transferase-like glycosyltransferase